MSVGVAVKVSEGLVLGADSALALQGRVTRPDGSEQEGILKTYYNATKLFQIGEFAIGALAWGRGAIGLRTIESLVREWEHDSHWQSADAHGKHHREGASVRDCAMGLSKHLASAYERESGGSGQREGPPLGMLVAGYSEGEFFPETWRFVLPEDGAGVVHNQRPDRDGRPDFGASWFGATDAIVRLHFGRDDAAVQLLSEQYGATTDEVRALLAGLEYQIPFAVMPLQDAIDYAQYLIDVVVGRFRFVVGPELCGGQTDIAAMTRQEFRWISRKTWGLAGRGGGG